MLRAGLVLVTVVGCGGTASTDATDPPAVDPLEDWQFEGIGIESGPEPRLFARPDGGLWLVTDSTIWFDQDMECGEGYLGGSVTHVWSWDDGTWTAGSGTSVNRAFMDPSDHPAAAMDDEGALWLAWAGGQGASFEWCGAHDLTVMREGADGAVQVAGTLWDGDRLADPVEAVGYWPAMVITEDGPEILYQRLSGSGGTRTTTLEWSAAPDSASLVSDQHGLGAFPTLVQAADGTVHGLVADSTNLHALRQTTAGFAHERVGLAPLDHPDLILLDDGTLSAVFVEAATGDAVRLDLPAGASAWTKTRLELPAPVPRRLTHTQVDGRMLYAWASDGIGHLAIPTDDGWLHERVEPPIAPPCTDADLAVQGDVVHLALYCLDQGGFGPSLHHAWRRIP